MTEQEILQIINGKLDQGKYTLKAMIIAVIISLIVGIVAGLAIGHVLGEGDRQALALEKNKPPVVTEKVVTKTETKLAYIPGETVYLSAPASSTELQSTVSKDTPGAVAEKLDGKFNIGKPNFNYMVNGKVGKFDKTDDEQFIFDKGMVDLKQTSTVTIQAEIPTIDLTRKNVVTVGAMYTGGKISPAMGYTGSMGKVGAYQLVAGKDGQYVGLGIKF